MISIYSVQSFHLSYKILWNYCTQWLHVGPNPWPFRLVVLVNYLRQYINVKTLLHMWETSGFCLKRQHWCKKLSVFYRCPPFSVEIFYQNLTRKQSTRSECPWHRGVRFSIIKTYTKQLSQQNHVRFKRHVFYVIIFLPYI